ncbi:hypothetical protein EON79_19305, partial [bacterium]
MAKTAKGFTEGDRVRVVTRAVTADDRKANRYYSHMAGLVGKVENTYEGDEYAIRIETDTLSRASAEVHSLATKRMHKRVQDEFSEEAKKPFTKEELEFDVHYVLLVQGADLE